MPICYMCWSNKRYNLSLQTLWLLWSRMNAGVHVRYKEVCGFSIFGSLRTPQRCGVLAGRQVCFTFVLALIFFCACSSSVSCCLRKAAVGACFDINTSTFRCNKVTCDFMSQTLILRNAILCCFVCCL